jgi:hypothetical protein
LERYLSMFGIPQEREFRRTPEIGLSINGLRRAFYFESIISSIMSYVRTGPISMQLQKLERGFMTAMRETIDLNDKRLAEPAPDFRSLLGIPGREEVLQ